jgi:hypothetical protein
MIGKILGSGQLGKLAGFVSPAFFDVMPARALWAKARHLFTQSRDREAFRHAVASRNAQLEARLPRIQLIAEPRPARSVVAATPPDRHAADVAELFFHQLFHGDVTLLDLRATAFIPGASGAPGDGRLIWHPAPWLARWSADFIGPLRELYRGFYTRDDAMFQRALRALSLEHSADLFRKQFGGDQQQMLFKTADFIAIFHQVFMRCKQASTALHPDFLPLGIYLAALYDHLEELAVPVNVARAFERATATPVGAEVLHA